MKKLINEIPPWGLKCKGAIIRGEARDPGVAMLPANANNDKKYFTFEARQYYAAYNIPGYMGLMIFTARGVSIPEYQFPELWMYYRHQKEFLKVKGQQI